MIINPELFKTRKPFKAPNHKTKSNTLTSFARRQCADWDDKDGCWMTGGPCRLALNKPCKHFKGAVLPLCKPDYIGSYPEEVKKHKKIMDLYEKIDKTISLAPTRKCKCGTPIGPRKKMCDLCRAKNRRETKKIYQQKYRHPA